MSPGENGENFTESLPLMDFVFSKEDMLRSLEKYRRKFGEKLDLAKKICPKKYTWFITINPHTDNLKVLRSIFEKILRKSYVNSCFYTYEQRASKLENVRGFHIHALFEFGKYKKKFDIVREFHSTAKEICKKNSIDVRVLRSHEDVERVKNYIMGIKSDEKASKVLCDMLWRKANGLEPNYYHPVT